MRCGAFNDPHGRASLNAPFRDGAVATFQLGDECKRVDGLVEMRRN